MCVRVCLHLQCDSYIALPVFLQLAVICPGVQIELQCVITVRLRQPHNTPLPQEAAILQKRSAGPITSAYHFPLSESLSASLAHSFLTGPPVVESRSKRLSFGFCSCRTAPPQLHICEGLSSLNIVFECLFFHSHGK